MFVVNKNINDRAARKIMKDTISLQDFIDTTVLSFFAGAIVPGAGVTLNLAKKNNKLGLFLGYSGCPPILNVYPVRSDQRERNCNKLNKLIK